MKQFMMALFFCVVFISMIEDDTANVTASNIENRNGDRLNMSSLGDKETWSTNIMRPYTIYQYHNWENQDVYKNDNFKLLNFSASEDIRRKESLFTTNNSEVNMVNPYISPFYKWLVEKYAKENKYRNVSI